MIEDTLVRQGNWFFRWRSYVLLGFTPLFILALTTSEPIETRLGATADMLYEMLCLLIAFIGFAVRAFTAGYVPAETSGRYTKFQVAASLNTTGAYSITRNPLYLGNSIIYMAVAMFTQNIYFSLMMLFFLVIYLERIIAAEEAFLVQRFGEPYLAWARKTPVFFPRFSLWQQPELPFSAITVLRREYSGFFAIIATFFLLDQAREFANGNQTEVDLSWLLLFAVGAGVYFTLRYLKKHTSVLAVPGR